MPSRPQSTILDGTVLGVLALTCYAVHSGFHLLRGTGAHALWLCNLGALLVGIGLVLGRPRLTAAGTLWLAVGTPLWLFGMTMIRLTGMVTSCHHRSRR